MIVLIFVIHKQVITVIDNNTNNNTNNNNTNNNNRRLPEVVDAQEFRHIILGHEARCVMLY